MTPPSGFELRTLDDCGHDWPCDCPDSPRYRLGADMTDPRTQAAERLLPLELQPIGDLLGAHIQATVHGHIIRVGPTTAEIKLDTGGTITLPLTTLTLTDPS